MLVAYRQPRPSTEVGGPGPPGWVGSAGMSLLDLLGADLLAADLLGAAAELLAAGLLGAAAERPWTEIPAVRLLGGVLGALLIIAAIRGMFGGGRRR